MQKLPQEYVANIRKEFKYGPEDKKASCSVGDGPMAVFCLLAIHRPSGVAYREEVKDKMAAAPAKFKDGTNPATHGIITKS